MFVTRPDIAEQEYTHDDQFMCCVQSVIVSKDNSGVITATIVEYASDWILPTWTKDYEDAEYKNKLNPIKVGDLIRIGKPENKGHTDYVTVMQIHEVDKIEWTSTTEELPISLDGTTKMAKVTDSNPVTTYPTDSSNLPKTGIAHIAIRISHTIDCTDLPTDSGDLSARHSIRTSNVSTGSTTEDSYHYYPMFHHKSWLSGSTLKAALDHGVKDVNCIKLIGYSIINKRQVGVNHAHEMTDDDYLILRIKEIDGKVISNNRFANGSFAVLNVGASSNNVVGAVEYSMFDTVNGIVTHPLDGNNVFRNLTLELTDRRGEAAHFGRLHLWFKLHVTHG